MAKKLEASTWPGTFQSLWQDDNDQFVPINSPSTKYDVGTHVTLKEYDPIQQSFSGRVVEAEVIQRPERVSDTYSFAKVRVKRRHHSRYPFSG